MSKHKELRALHHKAKGKYVKQLVRTAKNKTRNIAKATAARKRAEAARAELTVQKCEYCDGYGTHGDDVNRGETCKVCNGTGKHK